MAEFGKALASSWAGEACRTSGWHKPPGLPGPPCTGSRDLLRMLICSRALPRLGTGLAR